MSEYSVPSQDELPKGERIVFPGGEDYLLTVLAITPQIKPDFNGVLQDVLVFKFSIDSFADGGPLEDIDGRTTDSKGEPLVGKWIWRDVNPKTMGFMQNGTPSISRQVLLALNGIADMTEKIPNGNTDDLIGRQVIGTMIVKNKRSDGSKTNNITAFKPVGRRRGGRSAEQTVAGSPVLQVPSAPVPSVPAATRTRGQTAAQSPEEEAFAAAMTNVIEGDSVDDADLEAVKAFMDD